jgi:Glycosyl transferase family 11.
MKAIERWKKGVYKRALKWKIISPKVIVLMDGGICSQMHQFLLGRLFENKGYKVLYDLSFYQDWGTDMNFEFVRNFDLQKAFPYLSIKRASKVALSVYKKKFFNLGNNTFGREEDFSFLTKKPPVYLGGYYHFHLDIWLSEFKSTFKVSTNVLNEQNRRVYSEIELCPSSVAVHVRRGDLKVEIEAYGRPASLEYFQGAIKYVQCKVISPFFYFFSDEPEWVAEELIPQLPLAKDSYMVVNMNGSDKGYMDLFLIACCKHQITSKGTLGKYGALLGRNPDKIVMLCNDKVEYLWKGIFDNPVFI